MKTNFIAGKEFSPDAKSATSAAADWKEADNKLYRKFVFKNFSEALDRKSVV